VTGVNLVRGFESLPLRSAADSLADGEDVGGFFEVRLQRGYGVAGDVDEFGVAEHVAETSEAAFATQPGNLAPGAPGVREALSGFIFALRDRQPWGTD
jgi:hypothetical protein